MLRSVVLLRAAAQVVVALGGFGLSASEPAGAPAADAATPKSAPESQFEMRGHVWRPAHAKPTPDRLARLTAPDGFTVRPFAVDLGKPRIIAVAPDGSVYVTRRGSDDIVRLLDSDTDGVADQVQQAAAGIKDVHGIAFHDGKAYLAAIREVYVADVRPDGSLGEPRAIADDLPDAGQHPNRTLAVGPDGKLYLSIGSTCNACDEPNKLSATMVRMNLDGSGREVFATGLRNTIGFAWRPGTRELWGMDHGIDWLGDDSQREELNLIEQGGFYGWPWIYEDGLVNPADQPPPGKTVESLKRENRAPALTYTAHAAPMAMLFHSGRQFGPEFAGSALVAMRGSWNRRPPSGYEIVRVVFEQDRPVRIEPFVSGFLQDDGNTHIGRLVGLAEMPDGALLVSDDTGGVIHRIAKDTPTSADEGDSARQTPPAAPRDTPGDTPRPTSKPAPSPRP